MKGMVVVGFVLMALVMFSSCSKLHPIILVPGSGGNQLEARLNEAYKPSSLVCNRWLPIPKEEGGWFRLWFDPSVLLSPFTKCFAQRMILYYDLHKDDYFNCPGVETRVPDFGSTQSLLCLDPKLKHITTYMADLVDSLEQEGYKEGETLFGAPYDFRYGLAAAGHPSSTGSKFLEDLKGLIEMASTSNEGNPVIILSHSLGGLFALHLLNRNHLSWRRKYVKHFISLSAPWGGTVQEMITFASGYSLGVPLVDPLLVREEQRSSESNLWLLPSPKLFPSNKPLVITENRNYSASEIPQFLEDIGFSQGVHPYRTRILPLINKFTAPEVPVTCIVGSEVKTPETLFYGRDGGFDEQPEVLYGDGDGTVNMMSLLALESEWAGMEAKQTLKVTRIPHVSHTSILKDSVSVAEIVREISTINSVQVLRSVV
ncbi:lecithin-cholesterol acyltransferase-like 1 [Telopea speciosissima]|uniref:lecithin-cholesterol acyltransferase-like 1 n=1 Tax=Telopea speciosissima TaxID=54955 RepID=UPI001CC417E7|nr:lecithin-cholesterol acyltransferase-like 1 [Telopea speciosissima]